MEVKMAENYVIFIVSARDVQFSRKLIADDKEGITEVVTLSGVTKLKFKKGILYEVS